MILYNSAKKWKKLLDFEYTIEYFFKKRHKIIFLSFSCEDFFHLAGFQYLKDISLPNFNKKNLLKKILCKEITDNMIQKSKEYHNKVESRLKALCKIDDFFLDFHLYHYNPKFYSFYTQINADFLLKKPDEDVLFFFIIKSENKYHGCSIFKKDNFDFSENQKKINIQRIVQINKNNNEKTEIYKSKNYDNILKNIKDHS